jgi:hypothetical protein
MKKTKMVAISVAAFITLALAGCPLSLEKSADAADASLGASAATAVPAAFVGTRPPANFLPYFENRFLKKTRTVDGNTRVVVIHNSELSRLSAADVRAAKGVYNSGGVIVLIEPRVSDIYRFTKLLGATSFLSAVESTHEFCDIYAFKKDATFIVADIHPVELLAVTRTETEKTFPLNSTDWVEGAEYIYEIPDETPPTSTSTEDIISNEKPLSAVEYNSLMDGIIEWINTNASVDAPAQSTQMSQALFDTIVREAPLTNAPLTAADFKPQKVTISQKVDYGFMADSNNDVFFRGTNVILNYTIYAVYDKANDTDNYLVDSEIQVMNGRCYKKNSISRSHNAVNESHGVTYGYLTNLKSSNYLSGMRRIRMGSVEKPFFDDEFANELNDDEWAEYLEYYNRQVEAYYEDGYFEDEFTNDEVSIQNASPLTGLGTSTSTVSSQLLVSGALDLKGVPNVLGGFEKTVRYVTDLSGMRIKNGVSSGVVNTLTSWEYKIAEKPSLVYNYLSYQPECQWSLADPPAISRTDATFRQVWLWKVQNPTEAEQLAMNISFTGEWGGTYGIVTGFSTKIEHSTISSGELKHRIVLERPTYSN